MKKILIAIPTARYIEAETFKSIYDLEVPEGYEVTFQYFYGYRVDQVRNLIADWVIRGFDYLFSVDHDITFPPDTLKKLLSHDQDLVSGVYRQRLEPQQLEIFEPFGTRMTAEDLYFKDWKLVGIGGCGFGCVLVKKEVLAGVGYPQFEYHPALDHGNTISEDLDFCKKAIAKGFKLWCDPSIRCGHIGSTTMHVQIPQANPVETRLRALAAQDDLPEDHAAYLKSMDIKPKVIYDIGACVMHWTKEASRTWPESKIVMFDAMDHAEFLYKESGHEYYCGQPIGDATGKYVDFYEKPMDPAGNSYYKENTDHFTETDTVIKKMVTLDFLVDSHGIQLPDLVKIDVQGAELDVLRGAHGTLKKCNDIIIEMQHKEYNIGAPQVEEVTAHLNSIGFKLVSIIRKTDADGDYHFTRILRHQ